MIDLKVNLLEEVGLKAIVHVDEETGYAERVEIVDGPTTVVPEPPEGIDPRVIAHMQDVVHRSSLIGMKRFRNIFRTNDDSWLKIIDHLNNVTFKALRSTNFQVLKNDFAFDSRVHFTVDSIFPESILLSWFCETPRNPPAFEAKLEVHDFDSPEYPPPLKVERQLEFLGEERSAEIQDLIPAKWYRVSFRAVGGEWCPPVNVVTKTCAN